MAYEAFTREGRKRILQNAKRIVIKVGSNVLSANGKLDLNKLMEIVEIVAKLRKEGKEVILVSSGAVLAGKMKLGLNGTDLKKLTLGMQQSSAAIGQSVLMEHYNNFFAKHGQIASQLLLTQEDFKDELRHANLENTIDTLLSLGSVPIINENDPVSLDELGVCMLPNEQLNDKMASVINNTKIYLEKCLPSQRVFGDNDALSALVAKSVKADLLIMLSDVDGLYSCNPNGNKKQQARLLDHIVEINSDIEQMAAEDCGDNGKGGMVSKLQASKIATASGIPVIVANGKSSLMLQKLFEGEPIGTFFESKPIAEEKTLEERTDVRARLTPKLQAAKLAAGKLALLNGKEKNEALLVMAKAITAYSNEMLKANSADVENARKKKLKEPLIDRLQLNEKRIADMAKMLEDVSKLKDPVGERVEDWQVKNGLKLSKVRVPIGVIGVIYESRPNVTVDSIALCLKTGNAVILKGGSDALNSNLEIVKIIKQALRKTAIPEETVQFLDGGREEANELMKASSYVDLIIPRGSGSLIRTVRQNSVVPVLETGEGNCHLYVHEDADLQMALQIALNAKCQRPGVCNAIEKLVVNGKIADKFLPVIAKEFSDRKVEMRADERAYEILNKYNFDVKKAGEEDWGKEYLDLIIGIKTVGSLDEAIGHINKYGTRHSEAIITKDREAAQRFFREIDAAAVYWNASTRFTDGGEFGFGAEIGISTQKLHARGPVGLKELTSYKYIVEGTGQIRG